MFKPYFLATTTLLLISSLPPLQASALTTTALTSPQINAAPSPAVAEDEPSVRVLAPVDAGPVDSRLESTSLDLALALGLDAAVPSLGSTTPGQESQPIALEPDSTSQPEPSASEPGAPSAQPAVPPPVADVTPPTAGGSTEASAETEAELFERVFGRPPAQDQSISVPFFINDQSQGQVVVVIAEGSASQVQAGPILDKTASILQPDLQNQLVAIVDGDGYLPLDQLQQLGIAVVFDQTQLELLLDDTERGG
ncbi:hypothetical protein IQ273_17285 [Nodosilinea sp. LEGE 07298]|uniref:hypothetical protein n=1 Tax=Nodosilinea sp. LEGE 07298 TaxID=2777970 RepID=UPI00187F131E|nr:hypothetical protein [Nodosilinea sp. LEGE 07298]MBE9111161.1 hypothetical protein [Nodosilinea sp. LEGE 07298]